MFYLQRLILQLAYYLYYHGCWFGFWLISHLSAVKILLWFGCIVCFILMIYSYHIFQIILLYLSTIAAEELLDGNDTTKVKELFRDKRQIQTKVERTSPDLSGIQQGCRIEGYETREREICEEITERVCLVRLQIIVQ